MKVPSLALCACAAAAPFVLLAGAAHDTDAFAALTVADVSVLLADWNLDQFFGVRFAEAGVDGEALLHATKDELTEAFGGVAGMHWNRLFRKLEPVWKDNSAAVQQQHGNAAKTTKAAPQRKDRRQLADESDAVIAGVSLAGYTGVRISKANAMLQLCVWAWQPLCAWHARPCVMYTGVPTLRWVSSFCAADAHNTPA